jgi:hypothetical protein
MFWDRKIKCVFCHKKVLEKNLSSHLKDDFECNALKWRARVIDQEVYCNMLVDRHGGSPEDYK